MKLLKMTLKAGLFKNCQDVTGWSKKLGTVKALRMCSGKNSIYEG
jgi:hypothetical protein